MGTAGPTQHLSERAGAPLRDFPGLHVPADARGTQSVAAAAVTVTVSYDNLFIETGESIFEDLNGNNLFAFTERPVTNGSTVADVDRPDGGLTLSPTDLKITEGQGEAVADAAA